MNPNEDAQAELEKSGDEVTQTAPPTEEEPVSPREARKRARLKAREERISSNAMRRVKRAELRAARLDERRVFREQKAAAKVAAKAEKEAIIREEGLLNEGPAPVMLQRKKPKLKHAETYSQTLKMRAVTRVADEMVSK